MINLAINGDYKLPPVIGESSPITLTLETCGFVARIGLGRPNRKAKQRLITKASGLSLEQAIDGTSIVSQTLRRRVEINYKFSFEVSILSAIIRSVL
jgi:hypothetical protein